MRYEHEIRRPHNAVQVVLRAMQFIKSDPQGPAYLIASRETLEEEIPQFHAGLFDTPSVDPTRNLGVEPIGLTPSALAELSRALLAAKNPLIVTSYCGRSPEGFTALKNLAELLSIAVHENAPIYNNFPTTSYLHQGHQWNGGGQLPALAEADVVLVVDSDVPWIGAQSRPKPDANIYHIDCDPLKEGTTLWSLPCRRRWKADSSLALSQLVDVVQASPLFEQNDTKQRIKARKEHLETRFQARQARLLKAEATPSQGLTVPFFMSRLREACAGITTVGLNESTTNLGNVADHLHHDRPLSLIGSGGGSLGWYSGGAVGASLGLRAQGRRDDLVIAFTGDGTWLFGVPSCAYWMASKYETPFLTIVWNNGGWASPKNACLRIHPEVASQPRTGEEMLSDDLMVAITPSPSFGKIAEGAGNAWWATVGEVGDVDEALEKAIAVVRDEKRSALLEVVLPRI